jgi:hypothetical protein
MSGLHSEWTPGFKPPHALPRAGARIANADSTGKKRTSVYLSSMPADGTSLPPKKGGLRHVPLGRLEG